MFNFRSKDSVDYLRLMMTSNEIYLNYEVVDLVEIYNFVQNISPSEFILPPFIYARWKISSHSHV
jgi:hypothetical protein